MAKMMFNASRVYTYTEVLRSCALIAKREGPLLDELRDTFQVTRKLGVQAGLIGGVATRIYMSDEQKRRAATTRATDIDIIAFQMPAEVEAKLEGRKLIDKSGVAFGTMTEVRIRPRLSPYSVYKLPPSAGQADISEVDIFHGSVGEIKILPADAAKVRTFSLAVDGGDPVDISLADPGLLVATLINARAATVTRFKRAAYLLITLADEGPEIGKRYAEVMRRNNFLNWSVMEHLFIQILRYAGCSQAAVRPFVESAKKELGL